MEEKWCNFLIFVTNFFSQFLIFIIKNLDPDPGSGFNDYGTYLWI